MSNFHLRSILRHVAARYGKPVFIAETSWHEGHPDAIARFLGIGSRRDWWNHVKSESHASGVEVWGACWYPRIPCPSWDDPASEERWPAGWQEVEFA